MKQMEAMTGCVEGAALEMVVRGGFSEDRYEKTALECSRQSKVNVSEAQPGQVCGVRRRGRSRRGCGWQGEVGFRPHETWGDRAGRVHWEPLQVGGAWSVLRGDYKGRVEGVGQ